ncbi:MAG: hypothetical protein OXC02_09625, partial [Rhodobacteraceae bacterium]|nr:hypothetical protein [Paracoccaceae bacterium]
MSTIGGRKFQNKLVGMLHQASTPVNEHRSKRFHPRPQPHHPICHKGTAIRHKVLAQTGQKKPATVRTKPTRR